MTARWAFSPFDHAAHLLVNQPLNEVQRLCGHLLPQLARCGAMLPSDAAVGDQPTGRTCVACDLYSLTDEHAARQPDPGRPPAQPSTRQVGAPVGAHTVGGRPGPHTTESAA